MTIFFFSFESQIDGQFNYSLTHCTIELNTTRRKDNMIFAVSIRGFCIYHSSNLQIENSPSMNFIQFKIDSLKSNSLSLFRKKKVWVNQKLRYLLRGYRQKFRKPRQYTTAVNPMKATNFRSTLFFFLSLSLSLSYRNNVGELVIDVLLRRS